MEPDQLSISVDVFTQFKIIAKKFSDKTALCDGDRSLTYAQLLHRVESIAPFIEKNNPSGFPVGIYLPNSIDFPIAMLAVLATGVPYVPMDTALPVHRNELIAADAKMHLTITTKKDLPGFSTNILVIEDCPPATEEYHKNIDVSVPAYIIYTSGTTGKPKGVYNNQQNLLHDVKQYLQATELCHEDRLSLFYSPSVNGAIRDIYGSLLTGASLYILDLPKKGLQKVIPFIRQYKLTVYHSIPNIFRTILKVNPSPEDWEHIRWIYLAGDRIYKSDIDLYKKYCNDACRVYVGLGATEVATIYRQWILNKETELGSVHIPLGYAVEDRETRIVGPGGEILPKGMSGDIRVASRFISLGYWNNAEQTNKSFEHLPDGRRVYVTGDTGLINEYGQLELLGRKDDQVKVNGHRIELAEIEGHLLQHPLVEKAVVITRVKQEKTELFLFYLSKNNLAVDEVRVYLQSYLPYYMIPRNIQSVEEWFYLPNFKNDTQKFRDLAGKIHTTENILPLPDQTPEQYLSNLWFTLLGNRTDNEEITWKEAGGDSIEMVHLIVQLESVYSIRFPESWALGFVNLRQIKNHLIHLFPSEKKKKPRLFIFPALSGFSDQFRSLVNLFSEHYEVTVLYYPNFKNLPLKEHHWETIETVLEKQINFEPGEKINLLANCSAGFLMRRFLATRKYPVDMLALVDGQAVLPPISWKGAVFHKKTRAALWRRLFVHAYGRIPVSRKLLIALDSKDHPIITNAFILFCSTINIGNGLPLHYALHYFGTEHSPYEAGGAHWKPFTPSLKFHSLKGTHRQMFDRENQRIIIEAFRKASQNPADLRFNTIN